MAVNPIGGEFARVTVPASQAVLMLSAHSIARRAALSAVLAPQGSATPATAPMEAAAHKWVYVPVSLAQNHVANGIPKLY